MRNKFSFINPAVFEKRLAQCITEQGITNEILAERIDSNGATVSNWRRGHSFPSVDMLVGIADALNVSVDWLIGRKENQDI